MKFGFIAVIVSILLVGCGTTYKNEDFLETVRGNRVGFYLYGGGNTRSDAKVEKIMADNDVNARELCPVIPSIDPQADAVPPILTPLITSFAKYLFDRRQTKKINDLKALQKASTYSYSGGALFVKARYLRRIRCVVLERKNMVGEKFETGLLLVMKLTHLPQGDSQAFIFEPVLVQASNTPAKTKKTVLGADGKRPHPKINIAMGLALKATSLDRNSGLPKLIAVGSGAVTVANVELPIASGETFEKGKAPCAKGCAHSDLIPHIFDDDQVVSVSMGVTESGHVGIDFEQRIAEITAIKEAFGPAIADAFKEALSED